MRFTTETSLRETRRAWRAFVVLNQLVRRGVLDNLDQTVGVDLDSLVARTGLDGRVLRSALDLLVANGLLRYDGGYRLADNAGWVLFCLEEMQHEFEDMTEFGNVLMNGEPVQATRGGVDREDDEDRARFLEGLSRRAEPSLSESLRLVHRAWKRRGIDDRGPRILDFGGGHGLFAAAFADAIAGATAVLFDQPEVIPHARQLNGKKFAAIGGDFFTDDPGDDYDVVFLSNVVHGENAARAQELVACAANAVVAGGSLIIRDRVVHDDRSGPDFAVDFSITLSLYTDSGHTRTRSELVALLEGAGLEVEFIHTVHDAEYAYAVAHRPAGVTP